uniref:Putative minor capsid n=1 Tax=Barns Ness serrated wrack noda-like virus 2 TaxID=2021921 RepID=A0A221LFP0_9VIRU|nr:putative minor capsid [Barns Ness serrated wrack noda-like virus 2]
MPKSTRSARSKKSRRAKSTTSSTATVPNVQQQPPMAAHVAFSAPTNPSRPPSTKGPFAHFPDGYYNLYKGVWIPARKKNTIFFSGGTHEIINGRLYLA